LPSILDYFHEQGFKLGNVGVTKDHTLGGLWVGDACSIWSVLLARLRAAWVHDLAVATWLRHSLWTMFHHLHVLGSWDLLWLFSVDKLSLGLEHFLGVRVYLDVGCLSVWSNDFLSDVLNINSECGRVILELLFLEVS
jgi:hypothetical protein